MRVRMMTVVDLMIVSGRDEEGVVMRAGRGGMVENCYCSVSGETGLTTVLFLGLNRSRDFGIGRFSPKPIKTKPTFNMCSTTTLTSADTKHLPKWPNKLVTDAEPKLRLNPSYLFHQ